MNLTKKEIDILTLMDDVSVEGFVKFAKKLIHLPENEIIKIAEKLIKEKFVVIDEIKDMKWYFYTKKVNRDLLNDDLRWKEDYGLSFGQTEKQFNRVKKYREFLKDQNKKELHINWR